MVILFKSYSNFLLSNDFGAPLGSKETRKLLLTSIDENTIEAETEAESVISLNSPKCWSHLKQLFENSIHLFNKDLTKETNSQIESTLPIILCGFSKGCIVLNQLCTELEFIDHKDMSLIEFRNKISDLIYLDGGHCGTSNAWITREQTISLIKFLNWNLFVYITPYNIVCRSVKLWAIKEYEIFIELLRKYNVNLVNKCYFAEEDDAEKDFDLNKHFEILNEFEIFSFLHLN